MKNSKNGFALVSAIFLLVVIAALGLFAVSITTSQEQTSAIDVLGSRAYQAAKAGIEWGVYQIAKNNKNCTNIPQPTMPAGQLSFFIVEITCDVYPTPPAIPIKYTDGTNDDGTPHQFFVYRLTSTAKTGTLGTANYVERQLQVAIKNP